MSCRDSLVEAIKKPGRSCASFKAGLVILPLNLILFLVSLSTDYWLKTSVVYSVGTTTYESRNQGLWRYCQEYTEIHCCGYINDVIGFHNADVPAYVNATRAFMVIGLIFQIVCLCSLFGAVFCCSSYTAESSGRLYTAILCFGTAFCVLLSIIIYGGAHTSSDWTDQYSLHWSYAFAVISGIIYAIMTIVFLFDLCKD